VAIFAFDEQYSIDQDSNSDFSNDLIPPPQDIRLKNLGNDKVSETIENQGQYPKQKNQPPLHHPSEN
jgi:hypothetical protein